VSAEAERFARSFGRVAADYERARPQWPRQAIDRAAAALCLGADAYVLDLAAGTGKLTRRLTERFAHVVAVEPDEVMRSLILDVPALPGRAESIPLPDRSFDAVFVGDAFHWFDGPVALREIARVLKPHGGLVLLWNEWWDVEPRMPDEARAIMNEVWVRSGRAAAAANADWRPPFADSAFEPLHDEQISSRLILDAADLVSLYLTISGVASRPERERDEIRRKLRALFRGSYRLPVTTKLHWTRLTG
jgi:ubiquinone/menaquinone biosynthesis C-methylase UbiE